MKYLISLVLILYFFISASSQSKYVKKSARLYKKGKFEKCINSTKNYLKKERKSADLQYYIVASNYSLYHQSISKTHKYLYLKKTIKSWSILKKYNKNKQDYSSLEDSLIADIHSFSEQNYVLKNRTKTQYLHDKLAEVFSDTTELYRNIHQEKIKIASLKIDDSVIDIRKQALENAKRMIGVKYKYGGTDSTGFDCSGFTQYVYKSIGIELPHNANAQSEIGKTISLKDAKAGDLIFFGNNRAFHAGIIFNNNKGEIELIHCVSGGVHHQIYDDENTKYWLGRVYKVKQIIENK